MIDQNDDEIGNVSDLLIEPDEAKVRIPEITAKGFLGLDERRFLVLVLVLVPVEVASSVTQDELRINQTRELLLNSPAYGPNPETCKTASLGGSLRLLRPTRPHGAASATGCFERN
jgi:hypothetical protein